MHFKALTMKVPPLTASDPRSPRLDAVELAIDVAVGATLGAEVGLAMVGSKEVPTLFWFHGTK